MVLVNLLFFYSLFLNLFHYTLFCFSLIRHLCVYLCISRSFVYKFSSLLFLYLINPFTHLCFPHCIHLYTVSFFLSLAHSSFHSFTHHFLQPFIHYSFILSFFSHFVIPSNYFFNFLILFILSFLQLCIQSYFPSVSHIRI